MLGLVSTVQTAEAFPWQNKNKEVEESGEKEEKKKGWGSKMGAAFGGVVDTAKNVGTGAAIAVQGKLPGQENAGREEVQKIIRTTYDEIEATRNQLESDYDALSQQFLRIVGIVDGDAALAPEDSLIYEVQRFDSAIGAVEVPTVEQVQSTIGLKMDAFLDTSGAVDFAKYASTSDLLADQIGPRARQLRSLMRAELQTEDKRALVVAYEAFSTSLSKTVDAQGAFIANAQALETSAFEKKEAAKADFRASLEKMTGILVAEGVIGKQVMDFANVDSSEREKILIGYLGAEAADDIVAMFKVMNSDSDFWSGLDARADEMELLSREINESIGALYGEFGELHADVSQIAEEIGEERISGYFAEVIRFQNELAN
jgi:hypothetical protein